MTATADIPIASGLTRHPKPPPRIPSVDAARQFYLSGAAGLSRGWHVHCVAPTQAYYFGPDSPRLDGLLKLIADELTRLSGLNRGWDGHRAKLVSQEAVYGAILVLGSVLNDDSEPPQFFPLPDGGIQLEWCADDEIEIEIDGTGQAHVLATSSDGGILVEGNFDPYGPSDPVATIAVLLKDFSSRVAAERSGRD